MGHWVTGYSNGKELAKVMSCFPSVQCPVFLTNLEGKVGKVGKVGRVGKEGKVGKEGRLREKQLPILYQILQQSNKNGEKINEQFCCGNLEKA
jgi:hypothetical protein